MANVANGNKILGNYYHFRMSRLNANIMMMVVKMLGTISYSIMQQYARD